MSQAPLAIETPAPAVPDRRWPARYLMLDTWRGLAALTVVIYHVTGSYLSFGPSAVIVFFVISGYCITSAAESGLANRAPFRKFMWRRFRRIYPPYLCSLLFFIASRFVKAVQGGENELVRTPLEYLQNFTMTQWLTLLRHPMPPNDNPTLFVGAYWSLNYEEQFYLLMAAMMALAVVRRFQLRHFVIGLLGISLVWNVAFPFVAFGVFIDYWAHFALGAVVFYRLCRPLPRTTRTLMDAALGTLFVASTVLALIRPTATNRSVYLELAVASGFAIALLVLRPLDDRYRVTTLGRLLGKLGTISYSLYLTHQFNIVITRSLVTRLFPAHTPFAVIVVVQLVILLTLATAFWYAFERPFLNKTATPTATTLQPALSVR